MGRMTRKAVVLGVLRKEGALDVMMDAFRWCYFSYFFPSLFFFSLISFLLGFRGGQKYLDLGFYIYIGGWRFCDFH